MSQADRRRAPVKWGITSGALLCSALLMTGCASMPDTGEVTKVGNQQRADSDPQVRVFGVQPQKNEQPMQIVRGFLEATTSDEADYQTAKKYLAGSAVKWDPFAQITVLSGGPQLDPERANVAREDVGTTITLTGGQIATVDRKHSYSPATSTYRTDFHLIKVAGEWRIDSLPDGLVLSESDFQRIYRSVNMYYFAQLGPEEGQIPLAKDVLVADPVYVRRRIDPVTSTVQALLAGPSNWLQPVVTSAFPAGTQLKSQKLSLDDSGKLRVQLSDVAVRVGRDQCQRMAAQLLHTVQEQSSAQVTSVEVAGPDGSTLCSLGHDQAQAYAPSRLVGSGAQQYFVDTDHRMVTVSGNEETAHRVLGPFGETTARLQSVAVSRDGETAAGVRTDGRSLYVAPLSSGGSAREVLSSEAHDPSQGLTAPSWDGLGNLWVADRDPQHQRLLMWRDGKTTEVSVPNLADGQIKALRVAADGVRIALLVDHGGRTTLQLGRIERSGTVDHPQVSVTELRAVAPQLDDVEAASWAGGSRLVVVGKQSRGVQQLQYVDTDGSAAYTPTLPGISKVSAVAAFEDQQRPLLVASDEGMYRLPNDADWQQVSPDGTGPVYPG
ncbi:LpqB family beta-propeller domain-containing protein [Streptantibioticus ferralitis]|uniref:LpqB family beta-propeller domain-containing protein n=1 Tax=Streptantibioticus ferralitis TaxID=236510 RepID=A0ABT5YUF0_9ACTN|nr:LpqB family beta-propeller domain-containing protein [Streptantibioticus ferralitis]MDF2255231.1 LpqB family beta-propeller domain-containing protein [Streptantibioticus ferralitis]